MTWLYCLTKGAMNNFGEIHDFFQIKRHFLGNSLQNTEKMKKYLTLKNSKKSQAQTWIGKNTTTTLFWIGWSLDIPILTGYLTFASLSPTRTPLWFRPRLLLATLRAEEALSKKTSSA